jgi:hypothetical protein
VRAGAKAKTAARVNRAANQGFARGLKKSSFRARFEIEINLTPPAAG